MLGALPLSMALKVSVLWTICGALEYALYVLRWGFALVGLAVPWLSTPTLMALCAGWSLTFLLDRLAALALRRALPDEEMF